jgi:superfamily II DNA or RNA helicase
MQDMTPSHHEHRPKPGKTPAQINRTNGQLFLLCDDPAIIAKVDRACRWTNPITKETVPIGQTVSPFFWKGPPGLYQRVLNTLKTNHQPYHVLDQRDRRTGQIFRPDYNLLYPDVARDVLTLFASNENGTLILPTGSGKSNVTAVILDFLGTQAHGVVVGGSVFETKQLYRNLIKLCPFHKISLYTSNQKTRPARVVVTNVESCHNAIDPEKIEFFIGDEIHKSAKNTGIKLLEKLGAKCAYRYGLTATYDRSDRKECYIEAHIGPVIQEMTYQKGVENEIVAPMKVWTYETPTETQLMEAGWPPCPQEGDLYALEAAAVYRYDYLSCLTADICATQIPPTESLLICIEKIRQGRAINWYLHQRHGLKAPILHAKLHPKKIEALKEGFKQKTPRILIATKSLNTGYDYPELAYVFNAVSMFRQTDTIQRSGRASRKFPNKTHGTVIEIKHNYCHAMTFYDEKRFELYRSLGWEIIPKKIQSPSFHKYEARLPSENVR